MTERLAPAETYGLNVLASAIGRFAIPDLDSESVSQTSEMTERAVEGLLDLDVPYVPSTSPELLEEAARFDDKLLHQLGEGPISLRAPESLLKAARVVVSSHREACSSSRIRHAAVEQLVRPQDIADSYGLGNMWLDAPTILLDEVEKYGYVTAHPDIPSFLSKRVSKEETVSLIDYVSQDIFGLKTKLDVDVAKTDADDMYHVFWAPTSRGLDYATPYTYDRATQLSFDIPHNVAHLAHLSARGSKGGANRYNDRMDERAFFEAVAVLSEHIILQVCMREPERLREMLDIFGLPQNDDSLLGLSQWIAADRAYEFKLRAARLHADTLALQGMPFDEIVREVSLTVGISEKDARSETKKYLPWTGLGAVYTIGYNALLEAGVASVPAAITGMHGAVSTWAQFNSENRS